MLNLPTNSNAPDYLVTPVHSRQSSMSSRSDCRKPLITDFVTNFSEASTKFRRRELKKMNKNIYLWVLLAVVGLITALLCYLIEYVSNLLVSIKLEFISPLGYSTGLIFWILISGIFGTIAASCGKFISTEAEGSGLPEIKTILSGIELPQSLGFRTLLSKIIGVTSVTVAGLSIGKEGPFVHIAAIISHKLSSLFKQKEISNELLASAVAAGVCATFGAPVGGVLFSIEITSTYYVVSYMWKAYFCSICCAIVYSYLHLSSETNLIYGTENEDIDVDWQIFSFVLLGAFCGVLGAFLIRVVVSLTQLRKNGDLGWFSGRFQYTLTACLLCSVISYSFSPLMLSDKRVYERMFYNDTIEDWGDMYFSMVYYVCAKLILTVFSLSCPVPIGIFTTVFAAGSVLGRLWGEASCFIFGSSIIGVYALIGASCMASAVTHTISVAVIVFELTGEINIIVYMLSAVIVSFSVARAISCSAYDVGVRMKNLPYLPYLQNSRVYDKKARSLMDTDFNFIRKTCSILDILYLIRYKKMERVPVLDYDGTLVADIHVKTLCLEVCEEFKRWEPYTEGKVNELINAYMRSLKNLIDGNHAFEDSDRILNGMMEHTVSYELITSEIRLDSADLDYSPLCISGMTQIGKIHFLFLMLGLHHLYVTEKGVLIGILERNHIINYKKNV